MFKGNGLTNISSIASDLNGNVYVAGSTTSFDLPVKNATQPVNSGTPLIISDDGGQTWSPTGIIPGNYADGIVLLPLKQPVLLAFNFDGIYRSADSGQSWETPLDLTANRSNFGFVDAIDYDKSNPEIVYASSNAAVLKSTDGGSHWTLLKAGIVSQVCCLDSSISADPFRPGRIYYGLSHTFGASGSLYVSKDAGETWTQIPLPGPLTNPRVIADSTTIDSVYVYSYEGLYRSLDGGMTWRRLMLPSSADLTRVTPHPTIPGRL
jgi:photosystem II stability/assembly factor-like uncharacterized protein